jgi:hypothetical protein
MSNIAKVHPRELKIYFPRFIQGSGSFVRLELNTYKKPIQVYPNYAIYATYDQGSTKYVFQKPSSLKEQLDSYWNQYGAVITLVILGFIVVFVAFQLKNLLTVFYRIYLSLTMYLLAKQSAKKKDISGTFLAMIGLILLISTKNNYEGTVLDPNFSVYEILKEMRLVYVELSSNVWKKRDAAACSNTLQRMGHLN